MNKDIVNHIKKTKNRLIVIMRHGTKMELENRYDLPIYNNDEDYCQDDYKSMKLSQLINNRKHDLQIFSSPFLRTKQTATRVLNYIYKPNKCIYIIDGFGETFKQVSKYLKQCNDTCTYRIPTPRDVCMTSMLSTKKLKCDKYKCQPEMNWYLEAQKEVEKYNFSHKYNNYNTNLITNSKEHAKFFETELKNVLKQKPNSDIIIVTHGGNVRNSLNILAPRTIPRITTLPKTCGSVIFEDIGDGKYKILHADFFNI